VSQTIIGWSGRARHGKTECTLAVKQFAESEGKTVGVYDVGAMILKMCIKQNRLPQVKRENMTKDQLQVLIDVGKEMRDIDPNYWVKRVLEDAVSDGKDVAMCPNLRLPLEADSMRKAGGHIVRCTRLNANGTLYISPDRDPNDITETALEFWPADFYLTHITSPAGSYLIRMQAVTIYKYLSGYTG
jgi:hypothetical protein